MSKKGTAAIILFAIVMLVFISSASATVYFTQVKSVYNLGEMVESDVIVVPEDAGPIKIDLICDNSSLNIYKGAPPEKIQLPLTTLWMNSMTGECYLVGYYNGEVQESNHFKVSKKLEVSIDSNNFYAKPGESVTITGSAKRLDGTGISGNLEVISPLLSLDGSNNSKLFGKIENGAFSIQLNVGNDIKAGDYRLDLIAYEQTSAGERTGEGLAMTSLQVFSVLRKIDIAMETNIVDPGKTIQFKPIMLDQTGNQFNDNIAVVISNENFRVFEKMVKGGDTVDFSVPTNLTSGYYNINADANGLNAIKKFYVNEKVLAEFEIINGSLVVRNIGNVPYNKSIQVEINGQTFIKSVGRLMPGETKEFKLNSNVADGNNVKVSDGESEISKQGIALPITAAAVGVDLKNSKLIGLFNTPILWIILIIILALIILFLFRDIFKKKSFAYPAEPRKKIIINNDFKNKVVRLDDSGKMIKEEPKKLNMSSLTSLSPRNIEDKRFSPVVKEKPIPYYNMNYQKAVKQEEKAVPKPSPLPEIPVVKKIASLPSEAEQVLVMDGAKNRAAIVAVRIKNEMSKFAKENLEKAIQHVYERKGAVCESGNFIFVIFSPLITKSFKNEIEAVKTSEIISEGLKEHNRKFNDKIEFGIAVNSGEIINKIDNKKLKFTSLGSLTIAAKKLADISNGEVLITKDAYEKSLTEVKAEKKSKNGVDYYELKKVADYDKNRKFINDFLKRSADEKNRTMMQRHSNQPKPSPPGFKPLNNQNNARPSEESKPSQLPDIDDIFGNE